MGVVVTIVVAALLVLAYEFWVRYQYPHMVQMTDALNDEMVYSRIDFNPLVFLKNYTRIFATNWLVAKNRLLFFLAGISMLTVTIQAIRLRKISLVDNLMLSIFVSSFLFVGFISYQPPRYSLIFLVPVIYFVATLPVKIQNADIIKPERLKEVLTIVILVILFVNTWNVYKMARYLTHPQFSLRNVALQIKDDIHQDSSSSDPDSLILRGDFASTLAMANQMKFLYSGTTGTNLTIGSLTAHWASRTVQPGSLC